MIYIPETKKRAYENYTEAMDRKRLKELQESAANKKVRARQILSRDKKHEKNMKLIFKKT